MYIVNLKCLLRKAGCRNNQCQKCIRNFHGCQKRSLQRTRLGDVAVFENRQPVTAAKFINKSSLFIQLLGVVSRLELKPNSELKAENIFVAPPYCQTEC
jgi:hypothetical protein